MPCSDSPLVRDGPLGAYVFVEKFYYAHCSLITIDSGYIAFIYNAMEGTAQHSNFNGKTSVRLCAHKKMIPHTSPSWASYGVFFTSSSMKNDRGKSRGCCIVLCCGCSSTDGFKLSRLTSIALVCGHCRYFKSQFVWFYRASYLKHFVFSNFIETRL